MEQSGPQTAAIGRESVDRENDSDKPKPLPSTAISFEHNDGRWKQREPGYRSSMRTSMDSNVQQLHYNLSDLRSGRECLPFAG
jgi:hypothetical protein